MQRISQEKYQPTTHFPTLPMIFSIKKNTRKVPWDVINSHYMSSSQLRKNMLNTEGHGSEKQLKSDKCIHTVFPSKIYF